MGDVNSYALNLAFQVQTSTALKSLRGIGSYITDTIQTGVKEVSKLFAGELSTDVKKASKLFADIAKSTETWRDNLAEINKGVKKSTVDSTKGLKSQQDITTEMESQAEHTETLLDTGKGVNLNLKSMHGATDLVSKATGQVAGAWGNVSKGVKGTVTDFFDMVIGIKAITDAFAMFLQEENNFNTANYRIYGTQDEIIGQVNQITRQYGALRGKAMEAMVYLGTGTIKMRDNLGKYAAEAAMMNKITGVSIKEISEFDDKLAATGYALDDVTIITNHLMNEMRRLGLTTQQIEGILKASGEAAVDLQDVYGKDAAKAVEETGTAFAAAGKEMGETNLNAGEAAKGWLSSSTAQIMFAKSVRLTDDEMKGLDKDHQLALLHQKQAKAVVEGLNGVIFEQGKAYSKVASTARSTTTPFYEELLTNTYHLTGAAKDHAIVLMKVQARLHDQGKDFKNAADMQAYLTKEYGKAGEGVKSTEELYKESMKTLTGAWDDTVKDLATAWSQVMIVVAPALRWFIEWVIRPLIKGITFLLGLFSGWSGPVSAAASSTDKLATAAKPAVGFFEGLWNGIKGVTGAIGGLIAALWAIGAVIVVLAIFVGIWQWFMDVSKPQVLLSIALAAAALGFAFWALGDAIQKIADAGPMGIYALVGIAAIIVIIAAVMGALAAAGPEVTGSLLLVGGAFLMVGAAIWLVGAAVKMICEGFAIMVAAIGQLVQIGAGNLLKMGAALILFGGELVLAAISIGVGAALMIIAAVPLLAAMILFAAALWWVDEKKLASVGLGFLNFGTGVEKLANAPIGDFKQKASDILGFAKAVREAASSAPDMTTVGIMFDKLGASMAKANAATVGADVGKSLGPMSAAFGMFGKSIDSVHAEKLQTIDAAISAFSASLQKTWDFTDAIRRISNSLGYLGMSLWMLNIDKLKEVAAAIASLTSVSVTKATTDMRGLVNVINEFNNISVAPKALPELFMVTLMVHSAVEAVRRSIGELQKLSTMDVIMPLISKMTAEVAMIDFVFDLIAQAFARGVAKINEQMRGLDASLTPLEIIASKLGIPLSTIFVQEEKKKVKTEPVQTVQVLDETSTTTPNDKSLTILTTISESLDKISTAIGGIDIDDDSELMKLLQRYLPLLGKGSKSLGTHMNEWEQC